MDNDYTRLAQDIQEAVNVTETAYYNANDEDIQAKLDDAKDLLEEAKALMESRA